MSKNSQVEILVVEDSKTQAEQLRYLLERHGYLVSVAGDGKAAIAAIARRKPTLIMSDILMPEMDGYELCHHIKADNSLRDIPVVLVTSLFKPKDIIKALECNADSFITKPYSEELLLSRIRYVMANKVLRELDGVSMGLDISFAGNRYHITSDRLQILNMLLSAYEVAIQKNNELARTQDALARLNEQLEEKVRERTAALKESEEFNSSLLENSPNPIFVLNEDTSIRYANPAVERLTGFSKAEVIGACYPYPWWHPEHRQEYKESMDKGLKEETVKLERLHRKKSGEPFWVEVTSTSIGGGGRAKYRLVNWSDITERKKAEDALKESEEFSSSLLNNSPNPVVVFNPDASIRYVNLALERLTGFSKDELAGRNAPYPWWTPLKCQEYLAEHQKIILA